MHWNCPHCQAQLTAPADANLNAKTYVRCAKCGGASLLHRSAAVIEAARARRLEQLALQEERKARIEAEARIEAATAKAREAMNEAVAAAARATALAAQNATNTSIQAPPRTTAPMLSASGDAIVESAPIAPPSFAPPSITPPPFAPPSIAPPPFAPAKAAVPATRATAATTPAGMPTFSYAKPPAFLMAPSDTHSRFASNEWDDETVVEVHCGTITDNAEITSEPLTPMSGRATTSSTATTSSAPTSEKPKFKSKLSLASIGATENLSVWIAAALALASGLYLIHEGRKALAPAPTVQVSR